MGVKRTFRKAPRTRPRKKPGERRRRMKVQKKRLVALGMSEDIVSTLNARQVKNLLKNPKKVLTGSRTIL